MSANNHTAAAPINLTPELFAAAFPFHIIADRQLKVLQAGTTLRRLCAEVTPGAELPHVFQLLQPEAGFTADTVLQHRQHFFLLEHRTTRLQLRGQFVLHPERDVLIFLGSPWLADTKQLTEIHLAADDFAIHDSSLDLLRALEMERAELRATNERLQLREAEQRTLALIAARTDNSVALTDAERRVVWINEGFTRLTGYTLEEVAGKTPGAVLQGPETNPATIQHMREQLAKNEGFRVELINYSKAGKKYWVNIEVRPIRDTYGKVTNFMGLGSDITERKEVERLLRGKNALQRAMLEGAGYAIIATDTQGLIHTFNPAAERLLGYAAAELVGKRTPEVFHDAQEVAARSQELTTELGREIKPGFTTFVVKSERGQPDQREWTYIRKDGVRFPVLLSITTLFDDRGQITGYLGIATDLTDRKSAEEKLRATLLELERLNRVMMNREVRVLELKREINEMCLAVGQPPAYASAQENPSEPKTTN